MVAKTPPTTNLPEDVRKSLLENEELMTQLRDSVARHERGELGIPFEELQEMARTRRGQTVSSEI